MRIVCLCLWVLPLVACATKDAPAPRAERGEESVVADRCAKVDCAHDVLIELKLKDGSSFAKRFESLPVVQPSGVAVYAGQKVLFEADLVGGELTNLKLVSEVANPEKTISAELKQAKDGSMMLSVRNPFDRHMRISMGIMPIGQERLLETSSCPVIAKGASFETWPYPIFQVWLSGMRLMKPEEDHSCIE